jgi:hypothetical protein
LWHNRAVPRGSLIVVTLFALLGAGLGLYLGWVVSPVQYVDADPASLGQPHKDDYVLMIAAIYSADGDLDSARTRLAVLGFDDPGAGVAAVTGRMINARRPEADLRRLARLAAALNAATPEMQPYLP